MSGTTALVTPTFPAMCFVTALRPGRRAFPPDRVKPSKKSVDARPVRPGPGRRRLRSDRPGVRQPRGPGPPVQGGQSQLPLGVGRPNPRRPADDGRRLSRGKPVSGENRCQFIFPSSSPVGPGGENRCQFIFPSSSPVGPGRGKPRHSWISPGFRTFRLSSTSQNHRRGSGTTRVGRRLAPPLARLLCRAVCTDDQMRTPRSGTRRRGAGALDRIAWGASLDG